MSADSIGQIPSAPILLYDGGCATCCRIGQWVSASAGKSSGQSGIISRPVGDDPAALRRLNPTLDIWDAYAVVHVIMPDGSMKLGGEAVAEVLRRLPSTRWLARCFGLTVLGTRPFQLMLNLAYAILDDIRPLLGCDSCGRTRPWVRPFERALKWAKNPLGKPPQPRPVLHFTPLPAVRSARR